MTNRTPSNESGFTLVELMVVMVVMGILAGLVLFSVQTFTDKANASKTNANNRICAEAQAAAQADAVGVGGGGRTASAFAPGC